MAAEKLSGPVVVEDMKGQAVELDEDEISLLTKGPKFSVYKNCDREAFLEGMEAAFIKYRWDARQRDVEDKTPVEETEEEMLDRVRIEELERELDVESRTIFTNQDKVFNWSKQRATDCKGNTRVVLPKAMCAEDEAKLAVLRIEWNALFDRYLAEDCGDNGEQKSNLTPGERRGLKSLRKRVKDGDLVVLQTDKSGRFAIMSMETYIRAGEKHTNRDTEVAWTDIKENQNLLNGHVSMCSKLDRAGIMLTESERL